MVDDIRDDNVSNFHFQQSMMQRNLFEKEGRLWLASQVFDISGQDSAKVCRFPESMTEVCARQWTLGAMKSPFY